MPTGVAVRPAAVADGAMSVAVGAGHEDNGDGRPRVGVLAIQGDVAEHMAALTRSGAIAIAVRRPADLEALDGIILPGGESTAIGMIAREDGVIDVLRRYVEHGGAVWGTCAGMILLARDAGHAQPLVGGLDVAVERNAFGPQVNSFETDLDIASLPGGPFRAVFIRAPAITSAGAGVQVLAALDDGRIVAVRQGRLLATAFHPELTGDDRLHRWFVELCRVRSVDGTAVDDAPGRSPVSTAAAHAERAVRA
ncbi:MAG: pyridoxal 5'-phosphate synthase glutaminase subunit PdxT [Ardenticatenales bacterium]